jgi:hypothetical protein
MSNEHPVGPWLLNQIPLVSIGAAISSFSVAGISGLPCGYPEAELLKPLPAGSLEIEQVRP